MEPIEKVGFNLLAYQSISWWLENLSQPTVMYTALFGKMLNYIFVLRRSRNKRNFKLDMLVEVWTKSNPSSSNKTKHPYLARKFNFESFQTQVRLPKLNYKHSINLELKTGFDPTFQSFTPPSVEEFLKCQRFLFKNKR